MKESEELLNTLKSIDGILKRIEQTLQHEELKEVITHALIGDGKYIKTAIDSAIRDTSQ